MRAKFKRNDLVRVPCQIEPGPLDELLVTVDTEAGPISGFVRTEFLERTGAESGFIVGQIVKTKGETALVRLPGSFFRTTGIASVATHHLHQDA
jgi:hypothetical protein